MADNDRNRSSFYASDENWDQDQQGRHRRENEYRNQGRYGNVNYDREDDLNRNRGNYSGGYEGDSYRGNISGGMNYRNISGDYSREHGSMYEGNRQNQGHREMGYGTNYGNAQQSNYGGRNENFNRESRGNYGTGYGSSGTYGSDYGTSEGYHYGASGGYQGRQRRQDYGQGYINRDYGNMSGGYGEQNRDHHRGQQGYQQSGQQQYRGEDRGWWDKTRDEVSSWFGDEDAERRRRMDDQKTAQHKGKGPRGYQRSDNRIHEDVCDRLSDDPYVDASDIEVKVNGSEVILSGTVQSREDKRRAEELAERISGVKNVQNQLRVGHTSGTTSPVSNTITGTTSPVSNTPDTGTSDTDKKK